MPVKLLVIRFSSIGDIVLTTPVLRCIKQQLPGVELHFLTKSVYRAVVAGNPHIDKLHYLENDLDAVIADLKKEAFDGVIDLHHNLRTLRVKQALGVKKSYGFPKLNTQKWLYTNLKINLLPDQSIVERYFEAAKPFGVHNDGKGLDYFIPDTAKTSSDDIPASHWAGYIGCVIGGSHATKKLPIGQWQKFCLEVPYPVILLGGPDDREEGQAIAQQDPVKIYNSCGKFNLNESADLVRRARVIVSNDTGLMHVAAAFQKPIVSLWGNTAPDFGMFPYYGFNNLNERIAPQSTLLERRSLRCHPCSKIGYEQCPKKHFKCMKELDMGVAVDTVKKYWALNPT